jgi:hypothetical protein
MKSASEIFKSIRFAKGNVRGKEHSSTDDEEHGAVGEKEFNQQLKHVKKMAMQEEKKDKYDEGEYDQEGDMAKSDLRSIIANAQKMHDMIDDADNLPEWVQSKITKAEDYISTVANYMTSEMSEETKLQESGGPVLYKKGDDHIEKYGEDSFALYKDGKKAKYYTSLEAAKEAMNEEMENLEEKNVPTSPEKWAQAKSQAKAKFDVYPSAYANGWAAKKYKEMGGGWKSVNEETELEEAIYSIKNTKTGQVYKLSKYPINSNNETLKKIHSAGGDHAHAKPHKDGKPIQEEVEQIDEISDTTAANYVRKRSLGYAKKTTPDSQGRVQPSEVLNKMSDKHKEAVQRAMNRLIKPVSEDKNQDPPFEGPYTKNKGTVTDKSGAKHTPMSRARDIARMAMKKQAEKMKPAKVVKESKKADIVKGVVKSAKEKVMKTKDKFEADPVLTSQITK